MRPLTLAGLSSLRMLINALTASLLPVSNAIFIVMIVVAIYAVLGVSFFRADDPERFRTFSQSVFTMFQVLLVRSLAKSLRSSGLESGLILCAFWSNSCLFLILPPPSSSPSSTPR